MDDDANNARAPSILFANNGGDHADQVAHTLLSYGYKLIRVSNPQSAVKLARQHRPDLAIVDIPGEDSLPFKHVCHLQNELRVPVIVTAVTANDDFLFNIKCIGVYGYLLRPYTPAQIIPSATIALTLFARSESKQADAPWLAECAQAKSHRIQDRLPNADRFDLHGDA